MFKLLVSFGLGATITSGFAAGSDFFKGWRSTEEQRCSIAREVVLDESPSPALNPGQRARLNDLAMRRLEMCVGEST